MEERVLAKKDDLVAIADAIRLKTGNLSEMTLEQMPTLISEAGDGVSPVYQTIAENLVSNKANITDEHLKIFENVTTISNYAFGYCANITEAYFPNLIFIATSAFSNCSNLETVDFPKATTISSSAFWYCSKLVNANFPLVTTIYSQAFYACNALTSLTLPMAKTLSSYALSNCAKLVSLYLDFNGSGASISNYAFQKTSALTALVIRNETAWTLSNTNAFTNSAIASGTGYIYVPSALVETYKAAANWSTYAAQFRALEDYTVDGTITGALDETKISAANE